MYNGKGKMGDGKSKEEQDQDNKVNLYSVNYIQSIDIQFWKKKYDPIYFR